MTKVSVQRKIYLNITQYKTNIVNSSINLIELLNVLSRSQGMKVRFLSIGCYEKYLDIFFDSRKFFEKLYKNIYFCYFIKIVISERFRKITTSEMSVS